MDAQNKNKISPWLLLADAGLIVFVITNGLFAHGKYGQLGLALFAVSVVPLVVRRMGLMFDRWFIGYGLFLAWGAAGVLLGWAVDRPQAMAMVKTLVIDIVFLFVLFQYLTARRDFTAPLNAYMIGAFIVTLGIVYLSGKYIKYSRFGQAAGINPNTVANTLIIAYCGAVYALFTKKRLVYTVPAAFFLVMILFTGSRKGLLAVAAFTPVYVLWMDKKHILRDLGILALVGAACLAVLFGIPRVYSSVGARLLETVKGFIGLADGVEKSVSERSMFAAQGVAIFKSSPLKGCGYDCFRFASGAGTYAHNNYVELLADGGIVAFLLYYLSAADAFIRCIRKSENAEARFGAVLIVMFLLMDIATVSYYERSPLIIPVLALSALHLNKQATLRVPKRTK